MTKVIIFDFDKTIGTLVIDWTNWRNDILGLIHQFDSQSEVELKDIRHANQNYFIHKYGADFRKKLNALNEYAESNFVNDFIVNESVVDFIKNTDIELYCCSSNSRKTIKKYFHQLQISARFKRITSREDTYLLKPDNEGIQSIINVAIPKQAYLMVGDSEVDKLAAETSGINFIYVDDFVLNFRLN